MGKQATEMIDEVAAAAEPLDVEETTVEASPAEEVVTQDLVIREEREQLQPATTVLPSPGEWEATMTMAKTIASTTFVPAAYRGQPEAVVAAILFGREIGLGPMQALQKINIIDGKPSMAAELMLAQMRRGGLVILDSESDHNHALIHARRSDTGEEATVEWTYEEAAGITQKGKRLVDKDNWKNYPADMLWARCVGRLARRVGSDLLGGMDYATEEMQDWDEGGYGGTGYDTPAVETPVGKLTDWKDPRFDPAHSLAKDAPNGWEAIGKLILELDHLLADWISQAVLQKYGVTVRELPTESEKAEAGRRIANALARIRDDLYADGDFPPPEDEEYREVFEWAFGVTVEGPSALDAEFEEEVDAEDVPADTDGQESGEAAPAQQEPLPVQDGSQGHVGTAHPDE